MPKPEIFVKLQNSTSIFSEKRSASNKREYLNNRPQCYFRCGAGRRIWLHCCWRRERWRCCGSAVGRCGNVSKQLDPFHIGDYEMELVPCSAAIAGTWRCMTTLLLASAALVLLWLDGWPMRECKWTTRPLSCRILWNGVSSMFCRNSKNMALYDYIVVGTSSAGIALARWFPFM